MNLLNGISKRRNRRQNKISDNSIISVVDAGTNTFRLLISRANLKSILSPLLIEQRIVRLGEGFNETGIINKDAIDRAIKTLAHFYSISKQYNSTNFYVAGTSIFREAKNSMSLILNVKEQLGVSIEVLSPEQEAQLSVMGCIAGLKKARKILLIDIGGGSTEFVLWDKNRPKFINSLPLGVVHLREKFLKSDPPEDEELYKLNRFIANKIKKVYNSLIKLNADNDFLLMGTAGTVTTIGAILIGMKRYDREKINMLRISKRKIEGLYLMMSRMKSSQRLKIPGMVKGREDLIVPGIAIVLETMKLFRKKILQISDYGLLEGLAINFLVQRGGEV